MQEDRPQQRHFMPRARVRLQDGCFNSIRCRCSRESETERERDSLSNDVFQTPQGSTRSPRHKALDPSDTVWRYVSLTNQRRRDLGLARLRVCVWSSARTAGLSMVAWCIGTDWPRGFWFATLSNTPDLIPSHTAAIIPGRYQLMTRPSLPGRRLQMGCVTFYSTATQ